MKRLSPESLARHRCVACLQTNEITKEHFWTRWLVERCNSGGVPFAFDGKKKVAPNAITVPLCGICNNRLGSELEAPVGKAMEEAADGKGLSDYQAELIIRWLWKFEGLVFLKEYGTLKYSVGGHRMIDRVLNRIGGIRSSLGLAVAGIKARHKSSKDWPIGLCSSSQRDPFFVSGVFWKFSLMSFHVDFLGSIPDYFSTYILLPSSIRDMEGAKLFYPKFSFTDDCEAVGLTREVSGPLKRLHEMNIDRYRPVDSLQKWF